MLCTEKIYIFIAGNSYVQRSQWNNLGYYIEANSKSIVCYKYFAHVYSRRGQADGEEEEQKDDFTQKGKTFKHFLFVF